MTGTTADDVVTVGILGVGRLAEFIMEGVAASPGCHRFVLSPGSSGKAEALSRRYGAEVAGENQGVVDAADLVLVCLPAGSGAQLLSGLTFRQDQAVLSAMAGTGPDDLAAVVSPAAARCTMMPGHANALGIGPSLLYPADERCEAFLGHLGPVHVFEDEHAFDAACVFGAFSGASFTFMRRIISWFEDNGVPGDVARMLVAETLRGNADVIRRSDQPLEEIVDGIATPGGITYQCVDFLETHGGLDMWPSALDAVHKRMTSGME